MRLLDLYCGAGGAAMGYHRAGFEVVGVDIRPQPHYPFDFRLADSLTFDTDGFDAIHASPPCKVHSALSVLWGERGHLDLIPATRAKLEAASVPYVIENVMTAPIRRDVVLCGTMFGLGLADGRGHLQRHRAFELGGAWPIPLTPPCAHPATRAVGVYGHTGGTGTRSGNHGWLLADWCEAMQIDWMRRDELAQAIPPAYTEFLGSNCIPGLAGEGIRNVEPDSEQGFCLKSKVPTQTQTAA